MGNDEIINGKNSRTFKERKEMVNVEKEERKLTYGIRGKLISAVAMLLVAMIMVVSSTYAWFTLSTAPEVKGISTAVGANGALEMLLATKDDNGDWVYGDYDGTAIPDGFERNNYWGNLVDLHYDEYGSKWITLYPSELNITSGKIDDEAPLKTPQYGEDGRIQGLPAGGTFGTFNSASTNFMPAGENDIGFRALGVVSGLSERQKALQSSKSAVSGATGSAQIKARDSLAKDGNGSALASIAVRHGLDANAKFAETDLNAIKSMITGLEAALVDADAALAELWIAFALSGLEVDPDNEGPETPAIPKEKYNDTAAMLFAGVLRDAADGAAARGKFAAVVDAAAAESTAQGFNLTMPAALTNLKTVYDRANQAVTDAKTAATVGMEGKADTDGKYAWSDISVPLKYLVNVTPAAGETGLLINDMTLDEVKTEDGKGELASAVVGGKGIKVSMPSGSGVYADMAELCGDYTVDIELSGDDLAAAGVNMGDTKIPAKMMTKVTTPAQIEKAKGALVAAPAATENTNNPITEFYGYVIDLAFRTNAASSNLLLQTTPVDRIYDDNQADAATYGAGSTMTFSSTELTHTQIKTLMSSLRVVFFNTEDYTILANAKLDIGNPLVPAEDHTTVDTETNGIVANLYLCDTNGELITTQGDAVITALNQNVAKHVSVLVYLDGNDVGNEDVAATAAQSMSGKFNIQFSSSAALNPMDYADLHNPTPAP